MAPNYGYQASIAIGDALPVTQRLDFISETFSLKQEMPYLGGMRGVRARNINRVREGIRRVDGNIVCQPTALEWSYLLPWILGGTPVGTSYPIAETVPSKYIMKDMGSKVYTYDHCRVSKCTIACQQGETLKVTLDVAGVDEVPGNSGTFPVLTLDATTTPFMFFDVVLTFGGTTYIIKDLEFSIDNVLDTERFFSSKTLSPDAGATDRMVSFNFHAPHGDAYALFASGQSGVTASAVFTNGSAILSFVFGKVCFPAISPPVEGRGEILLPMRGVCYATGAAPEITCTLTQP